VAAGAGVITQVALRHDSLLFGALDDVTCIAGAGAREIVLGCDAMARQMAA
jgi:hypothetical protein